jgi:hypothetical protein
MMSKQNETDREEGILPSRDFASMAHEIIWRSLNYLEFDLEATAAGYY